MRRTVRFRIKVYKKGRMTVGTIKFCFFFQPNSITFDLNAVFNLPGMAGAAVGL